MAGLDKVKISKSKKENVKPKDPNATPGVESRLENTKVDLDVLSKTTASAKCKISKVKKEVKPKKLEKASYQKRPLPKPMSRSCSPELGAMPDCWSCAGELSDYPPCSCEECGMPN
ncbi:hypothetical protein FQN49_006127 [Arthroderma sp. PD_2]|nr:hypothetical protein FQN49_006127 [Arthroderma sp. PD_2]